ncbi:hypothetical protein C2869_08800 [Saccharobesus litoralis]|uniref:Mechanosensitive ion channel MscS domain-containing protein n=1 Tax=Saccharobesus litoralis TaxID=2172099 RepID=A0A2S0VQP8_9ALTE|nr:mechanosensitive ion channel domain-containing protein [Saccharobesus litoralis]AWB66519.1 hypothetical protein C2869_08800 [Saccharobesus litoralis]
MERIEAWYSLYQGLPEFLHLFVNFCLLVMLALFAYYTTKIILRLLAKFLTKATKDSFDASLKRHNVLNKSARLGSLLCLVALLNIITQHPTVGDEFILLGVELFAVFVFIQLAFAGLNVVSDSYRQLEISRDVPINAFVQIIKLLVVLVALVLVISLLTSKSPVYLLSSLGAITAVLLLVFRDTILGFVGGVQIIANRLISVGDWIEVKTFDTDGIVLEIGLNTIKVQNWDKTISSIPTHSVMSNSFKNWKGMERSGGRRIKRPIFIDIQTITALDETLLAELTKKFPELAECDTSLATSNLSLYRRYVELRLKQHPKVKSEFTLLVRELAPTAEGVPVELYCFTNDNAWRNYEEIQADLINYMLVLLPEFGLRGFQRASGADIQTGVSQVAPGAE